MGKRKHSDLLTDHQEWVDHTYNSGYWINRISYVQRDSWRWIRKHNRFIGVFGMIISGLVIYSIINYMASESLENGQTFWQRMTEFGQPATIEQWGMLLLFAFGFAASTILFFQSPYWEEKAAVQPGRNRKREKKKKLPKRRKDYK
jgi:hypothetical protein